MDNNELLMIVLAFVVGYMVSGMMKQMCGGRLVEGTSPITDILFNALDADGDGFITRQELINGVTDIYYNERPCDIINQNASTLCDVNTYVNSPDANGFQYLQGTNISQLHNPEAPPGIHIVCDSGRGKWLLFRGENIDNGLSTSSSVDKYRCIAWL